LSPPSVGGPPRLELYGDITDPFSCGLRPDRDQLLLGPHPQDLSGDAACGMNKRSGPHR
jgi:hypothetical protein